MSDRINGFVVILDKNYKDEEIEQTINAIEQIKGVIDVKPNIVTSDDYIAEEKTKLQIVQKIYEFAEGILFGEKK